MRRHHDTHRKHPFAVFGLAALLTAPATLAPDGADAAQNLRTRPAAERAADRDDDRAVRTRPRDQRAERQRAAEQRAVAQRAARARAAERARAQRVRQSRARQVAVAGFPFLGGGHGVRLQNWPRTRFMNERELQHVLGRDTFRQLERDVRAQGLPTNVSGVWDDRDGRAKLDLSAGRIFIGRLIDHNRDGVFDEARPSRQFHNWVRRGRR